MLVINSFHRRESNSLNNNNYNQAQIQLASFNQFGEFYFYINPLLLQEYLNEKSITITLDEFLGSSTIEETQSIYLWLREKSTTIQVNAEII